MERATGVEPATSSLGSWHSTTELHPLCGESKYGAGDCQFNRADDIAADCKGTRD
jgi:hypothetical protein